MNAKIRRSVIDVVLTIAFVGLSIASVKWVAYVCRDKDFRIAGIFAQPNEKLDMVCIGSSHAFYLWNPMVFYEKFGLKSCMFGSPSQPAWVSLSYLEYALGKHRPDVVFVETYSITRKAVNWHTEGDLHRGVDALSFGLLKAKTIERMTPETDFENYYFDLFKYHSRWKSLRYPDWSGCGKGLDWHGYNPALGASGKRFSPVDYSKVEEEPLSPDRIAWLDKFVETSRKSGAKICFFTAPCNAKEDAGRLKFVARWCEDRGIPYFDMNSYLGELGLNFRSDFNDPGHLNMYGAHAMTEKIGQWLVANCDFAPSGNSERDMVWARDVELYEKFHCVAECLDFWRIDCGYSSATGKVTGKAAKDEGVKITYPRHLAAEGKSGCQIVGRVRESKFRLSCDSDGTVVFRMMGKYVLDGEGKVLPIKQEFASFKVNGRNMLQKKEIAWHDKSCYLRIPVKKGDVLQCELLTSRHRYPKAEARELLGRFSCFSNDVAALNLIIEDRNFQQHFLMR